MEIDKIEEGKKNRKSGAEFEREVRKDLESNGWIVDKWSNNVDLDNSCYKQAGIKYIPGRGVMPGTGFPDFIAFQQSATHTDRFFIKFVECKIKGILNKIEKLKMKWLKEQGFECWVASKNEENIIYKRPNNKFKK